MALWHQFYCCKKRKIKKMQKKFAKSLVVTKFMYTFASAIER